MTRPVLVFGATDLARLAHHYLVRDMRRAVCAFAVDRSRMAATSLEGLPVMDWVDAAQAYPPSCTEAFVAIGYRSMHARHAALSRAKDAGYRLVNVLASSARIDCSASLGVNNFLHPGSVVEPFVRLGDNNVLWSNSVVCHDSVVHDSNFIAAGAVLGGHCRVGSRCFIGFGAVVLQGVHVGDDVLVGAQSMLNHNAASLGKYLGVPARRTGEIDESSGIELR